MESIIRTLRRFYEKNHQKINMAIRNTMIILYATFFIIVAYQAYYSWSLANMDDFLYQQGIDRSEDVVIIAITDEDMDLFGDDALSIAAECAEKINSKSSTAPAAIGFDIPLTEVCEEAKESLINAGNNHDNLVLAAELGIDESLMLDSFNRDSDPIISEREILPDEDLMEVASVAHIAKITDKNMVLRQAVFDIEGSDGTVYSSMAYACYEKYCEANGIDVNLPALSKRNTAIIKYSDKTDEYTFSASDILLSNVSLDYLDNKIVMIGYYSNTLDYGYATSIDYLSKSHSVEVDAEIANGLIQNSFAEVIDYRIQLHVLIACILLIAFFTLTCSLIGGICINILYMLLLFVFAMLTYGIGYQSFVMPHVINAVVTSLIFGFIGYNFRSNQKEKTYRNALSRYLDDNNLESIIQQSEDADMGVGIYKEDKVRSKKIAVLFADIRHFTTISEGMEAKELVSMLNEYLSMMAECVERYGGTLDKFIGDCAMAYWGSPEEDKEAVYHACLAAYEMQRRTKYILSKRSAFKDYDIQIGVGINYGDAVVGNIGSLNRMNYTAVGDTVNIASRIEEMAGMGEILLSEYAYKSLMETADAQCELVNSHFTLRGKVNGMDIYRLNSIAVHDIKKENEEIEEVHLRGNRFIAAALNLIVAIIQLTFAVSFISEHGINTLPYFNVVLAVLSGATLLIMAASDVGKNENNKVEYRPKWLDIMFLMALAANVKTLIAFIFRGIPKYGWAALSGDVWAGGITICLLCPLLVMVSFFLLEYPVEYKISEAIIAESPLASLLMISTALATKVGLNIKNPDLYEIYFSFPLNLVSVVLEFIGVYMLTTVNKRLKLQELLNNREKDEKKSSVFSRMIQSSKARKITVLVLNALVFALSLISILDAIFNKENYIYSNSSILSIFVSILSLVIVVVLAFRLDENRRYKQMNIYAYLCFTRNLCAAVNLFSATVLAVNDNSFLAFLTPHWGYSILTYLFVPILCLIMMTLERNELNFFTSLLCGLVPISCLVISGLAINHYNLISVAGPEFYLFYEEGRFFLSCFFEVCACLLMFLINTMMIRVRRLSNRESQHLELRFAGTRQGICGQASEHSEFGQFTECYVLKEGDYAIIVGAGSGLIKAKEMVKDCHYIDIFIINGDFDGISGFLAVPHINNYAKVHIYSPFDFSRFSQHPFWPIDIIEGTRVKVEPKRRIRLNSVFTAQMFESDKKNHYILKVYTDRTLSDLSSFSIAFLPCTPTDREVLSDLKNDTYAAVLMDGTEYMSACYLAIQNNIPKFFVAGYNLNVSDEEILSNEERARTEVGNIQFARKGKVYNIY